MYNQNFEADNYQRISSTKNPNTIVSIILKKTKRHRAVSFGNTSKFISLLMVFLICFASINLQALNILNETNSTCIENHSNFDIHENDCKENDSVIYEFVIDLKNNMYVDVQNSQNDYTSIEDSTNKITLFNTTLGKNDAMEFEKKLSEIRKNFGNGRNPDKNKEYSEEALEVYREYSILPECFTYENISDFIKQITTSFSIKISDKIVFNNKTPLLESSGLTLNGAILFSVLSYINVFGSVKPFGFSYSDKGFFITALPGLRNLTILNIVINSTGWYIKAESLPDHPLFLRLLEYEISWKIDGPIWNFIWKNLDGDDDYIQFKSFFGIGIYNFFHGLLGNAITLGAFSGPQIDGRLGQFKMNQPFLGNFIWAGTPFTLPFSFTLYKTHPVPWTVAMEIGVVPTLGISVLTSLLYLEPK